MTLRAPLAGADDLPSVRDARRLLERARAPIHRARPRQRPANAEMVRCIVPSSANMVAFTALSLRLTVFDHICFGMISIVYG